MKNKFNRRIKKMKKLKNIMELCWKKIRLLLNNKNKNY